MKRIITVFLILFSITLITCDSSTTKSKKDKYSGIIEGVDFDELFAEPTTEEINAIYAEWGSRVDEIRDITFEDTLYKLIGSKLTNLYIISHVNGEGLRHYGAVLMPTDTTLSEYPVLFYNHGGDNGVDITSFTSLFTFSPDMVEISQKYMIVIPSFRAEPLNADVEYLSEGDPSPWDKDVDDCIGLLTAVQVSFPKSDMKNVFVVGVSRGAGVAMLWGARDNRIKKVIDFFGPTDLISDWTKEITYDALMGTLADLPGLDYLDEAIIQPLKSGNFSIEDARIELIKRSPYYFLENITPLQIHHGLADEIVPVSQSEEMIEKASNLNLSNDEFQSFLYEYSGHDENTFLKGIDEMKNFILN